MRKFLAMLLCFAMIFTLAACNNNAPGGDEATTSLRLEMESWNPTVKDGINAMLETYGKDGGKYDDTSYAVFDFDNTCSIFDLQEQLAIYQLQTMAFAFAPEQLGDILKTELGDLKAKRGTDYCTVDASYQDWIDDITVAYKKLYADYGPFTPEGLSPEQQEKIQKDDTWKEFATKMRAMYDLVYDSESAAVAYPWVLYWFTGMTEQQAYDLAKKSHIAYKDVDSEYVLWTSPESIKSKIGVATYEWTKGVQVSDNIKELMAALKDNGIKVWICSASATDNIMAAIDVWGLHDYIEGVLAMTNKLDGDGKYINEYDYETGYPWLPQAEGKWKKGEIPTKSQTWGEGKVTAISNVCGSLYGHGPMAGFMDSTGDYQFCTEYKTLKLVTCFNRASRKVTDGGGVIAELAVYQKDNLKYDFAAADKAGDTLYVLQGRDENGKRTLRNSEKTIRLGKDAEQLFRTYDEGEPDYNQEQLNYMIKNNMSTEEVINTFAVKTDAEDGTNVLGFKYGFFQKEELSGYHTRN